MMNNPCFQTGDFHCGRCGTALDGDTDEPVSTRELRQAARDLLSAYQRGADIVPYLNALEDAAGFSQQRGL